MAFKVKVIEVKTEFEWKQFIIGAKRPLIATIATVLGFVGVTLSGYPQWDWLGAAIAGLSAERIWSTVEFYLKR